MKPSIPVHLIRDGSLVQVVRPSPRVSRLLESTLTYSRIIRETNGWKMKYGTRQIQCYRIVQDPDGLRPSRFVFAAGYLKRVSLALRDAGYRPLLKTLRADLHPERFQPCWSRLDGVQYRWMQRPTLERLLRTHHGRVTCPTGWGKGFLLRLICDLLPKAKIVLTTHSVDVMQQLYETLCETLPRVGLITGQKRQAGSRVVCCTGKSLGHIDYPVDLLLADELHELATDAYFATFASPAFRFSRRWGFSANNDDRDDAADFELEGFFGPVVVKLSYADCVAHDCVVPIRVLWRDVHIPDPSEGLQKMSAIERAAVWRNQKRNELIAQDARSFGDDEQVLVVVSTIEHALWLWQLLPEFEICYAEGGLSAQEEESFRRRGLLPDNFQSMTAARRRRLKKDFESGKLRKVIANSVWKRGVDFRGLSVLIRADAQSSTISNTQIPGRTSRLCRERGKEYGLIVDYRDQFNKGLQRRAAARRRDYATHEWEQILPEKTVGRKRLQQKRLAL